MTTTTIYNPHLEGDAFLWEGGPTGVLLIHGFTATTAEVRPLAQFLCEHGYTVAGPLLPGHGTQPEDANRFTWRDWARAAEESFRKLTARCERIVVGGQSTGALLALHLASEHPEVLAVLAYAPALRLKMPVMIATIRVLSPFVPYIRKGPRGGDPLWQGYTVYPLKGARELLRLQRAVRGMLPRVNRPILIMQGGLDATVHPGAPETIHREVRSSVKELRWMPSSRHHLIADRERAEVAQITLDFLRRVGA